MKKYIKFIIIILLVICLGILFIIYRQGSGQMSSQNNFTGTFPNKLNEIPNSYKSKSNQPGQLENLYYDTYESFSYSQKTTKLNKRAVVYLPYGYDKNKKYPVIYLMHGGWSNETTYLGTPEQSTTFKNIIDNAIKNGDMTPAIIICPTYNNTSGEDSGDYSLALRLTNNYHNELNNDLIPTVDKKYSTIADRNHRAFVGFSMGSVTTWRTLQYSLDYFRYFMPSSGGPMLTAREYDSLIKDAGYDEDDFFIFAASGTEDFAYSGFKSGIDNMTSLKNSVFKVSNDEKKGNIYYLEKEGAKHDGDAAMLYFYNGMSSIWK